MAAGSQIKDPDFIANAMRDLMLSGEEFPVKVEGTKTLPYSAILIKLDACQIVVKLVRPLPPALANGALFEMVFATQDKRFEGRITFIGREGYLQYRFVAPRSLLASDRRLWKRYPIRPREDFHVAAQDSDIPGHGLTGPLLNLSLGGLAFRVDRMVRLEDGMPIRPGAHLFDRGKILSLLRIRGLPRGAVLEARGVVVRVQEANSELQLGVQFTGLGESEKLSLARLLETRERQSTQGSGGFSGASIAMEWPVGASASEVRESAEPPEPESVDDPDLEAEPEPEASAAELAGMAALATLDRRSTRILLVAPPGEDCQRITEHLQDEGFWRLDSVPGLFEAHAAWKAAGPSPFRLLLVDLEPSRADGLEPMGAVRHLEPLLRSFGEIPVAFVTRAPDPLMELMGRPGFAALSQDQASGPGWADVLSKLL
jgi:CheY-like chemotaxis protein